MKLSECQSSSFVGYLTTFFLVVCVLNVRSESDLSDNPSSNRDPKYFLSVSVPPDPCGDKTEGVCYPRKKCLKRKGTVGNMCAQGFGECCSFESTCNATVSAVDVTEYVTTLRAPVSITNQCSFRLKKPKNVCQVRLDFKSFATMNSADENGNCRGDRVTIKGSTTVIDGFTACGNLNGQHMYLSYGNGDTIEVIAVHMQGAAAAADFIIVATQIPCSSSRRVPENCFQYYNTSTGVVKSFDWGFNGQQQSNQKYTVCVKEIISGGSIVWSPCSGSNLGNNMLDIPFDIVSSPPFPPAVPSTTCEGDWIQINGNDRLCAGPLPVDGITSSWGPYLLNVNFDDKEITQFPFSDSQAKAIDQTSCTALEMLYVNLIMPGSCIFYEDVKQCQCSATDIANTLIGLPDVNNQGFCLQYTQM